MAEPPSKRIENILRGITRFEDEDESIQSAVMFPIYQGAVSVLSLSTKEERRAALSKIPDPIRPYVEAEAIRIHNFRRTIK